MPLKKIIYKLSQNNTDLDRDEIIEILIILFDIFLIDFVTDYLLFLIVKYLKTADESIFLNNGDYFTFNGLSKSYAVSDFSIYRKIGSKSVEVFGKGL